MPNQNREDRSVKIAKVCDDVENVMTAAKGLLHMSAITSSCEDAF